MLRGAVVALDSDVGTAFVSDCARYLEELLTEDAIRAKYSIDEASWVGFSNNGPLRQAVENETARRISSGSAARERAQVLFAGAPDVLGDILHGDNISPRHKIDSVGMLRQIAANIPEGAQAAEYFSITINLGSDVDGKPIVERYDKTIAVNANDITPNDTGTTSKQGMLAATTTTIKSWEGDDGEPV
jgi:hypothetical protein